MENIFLQIQKDYHLSSNDIDTLQYIYDHIAEIRSMTSRVLASKANTNAMAIIRLGRKLGFSTYQDFIYHIDNLFSYYLSLNSHSIDKEDDTFATVAKITELKCAVIQRMKSSMDMENLKAVLNLLHKYEYIDFIAYDTSAELAAYASHLLFRIGKIATVYDARDKQLHYANNPPEGHIIVIISRQGANNYLHDIVLKLKQKKIPMICITGKTNTYLTTLCDYKLLTVYEDNPFGELIHYMSVNYILELLFALLRVKNYETSKALSEAYTNLFFREFQSAGETKQ